MSLESLEMRIQLRPLERELNHQKEQKAHWKARAIQAERELLEVRRALEETGRLLERTVMDAAKQHGIALQACSRAKKLALGIRELKAEQKAKK